MSRLVDIKGYWNMVGASVFKDDDSWKGKILLDDDGWFEGIVNDSNSSYTGDRMVYGIYHPGKIIRLVKVSPKDVSNPLVFEALRDVKGYNGKFSMIEKTSQEKLGSAYIITGDVKDLIGCNYPEYYNRNVEIESDDIMKRLNIFKSGKQFTELYDDNKKLKEQISEILLQNYENKRISNGEVEKRILEFKLNNQ